jgi:hypothetical protein
MPYKINPFTGRPDYYESGGAPISLPLSVSDGGTGQTSLTDGAILVGNGTNPITQLSLTNGQLPIGSTGADPVAASLTQPAAGVTITGGAGSITFALADDLAAVEGLGTTGLATRTGASTWTTRTLTAGTGISISNGDGVSGSPTITSTVTDLRVAKWIVDPVAGNGTHTTITSALASASAGEDIFIRPGTYTENITAKAGVNLIAWDPDLVGNVTLNGRITCNITGTVNFSGLRLQTNSLNIVTASGSNAQTLNFYNCYFNCTTTTGINDANTNTASSVNLYNCFGDMGTTGIAFCFLGFHGGSIYNTVITNSGGTANAVGVGAGTLRCYNSQFYLTLQPSSTGQLYLENCSVDTSAVNLTCVSSLASSGSSVAIGCNFSSGTASAITVSSTQPFYLLHSSINSSNANAVTGGGTLNYSPIAFYGSSSAMNITTQTPLATGPGGFKGLVTGTPASGFLGEQVRSTVAQASAITLANGTAANVTSISLTAGIWDVTGVVMFNGNITGTASGASIGTTSNTTGTLGDNYMLTPTVSTVNDLAVVVPPYRISLTSTTTVYLVAICAFTAGTSKAYGRISATRVG